MRFTSIVLLVGLFAPFITTSLQTIYRPGPYRTVEERLDSSSSSGCLVSSTLPILIHAPRFLPSQEQAHLLSISTGPRLIVYHQTFYDVDGNYHSLLPLLTHHTGITHVIIAAIHVNEEPGDVTLNNNHPFDSRFDGLWAEVGLLQAYGVKVLGMLGGAAKGSYERLGGNKANFESYYTPLRDTLFAAKFDGIDLDIEEDIDIDTVTRLIARLRMDFGPDFLITLAPVASALIPNPFLLHARYPLNPGPQCSTVPSLSDPTLPHLSGFSYAELEHSVYGREIAWYNTQFYGGWGNVRSTNWYDRIIEAGWKPERIVLGAVTNPQGGSGYVPINTLVSVTATLREKYRSFGAGFGGVMGWEYAGSMVDDYRHESVCTAGSLSIASSEADWVARLGNTLRAQAPVHI